MRFKTYLVIVGFFTLYGLDASHSMAASIAYIHGDVSADGTAPSSAAEPPAGPYDQMLLDDSGSTGLSIFMSLVESQGHTIAQYYDADTDLTASFLSSFDVVIFGLHQKLWSSSEKAILDDWLQAGGGVLIYSDSASGGCFCEVGAQNPVGQTVTNNIIAQYGMQVTVDQANGVRQAIAGSSSYGFLSTGLVLEGEGVSPVAVGNASNVEILIPFTGSIPHEQNITIANPTYAALAISAVGQGHISVMFDRQPMWNNGAGSDIEEEDNTEILRRLIDFLAIRPSPPPVEPDDNDFTPFFNVGALILLLE